MAVRALSKYGVDEWDQNTQLQGMKSEAHYYSGHLRQHDHGGLFLGLHSAMPDAVEYTDILRLSVV